MRLELTGRHITITPGIRRLIEQRLAPMLRLLNDSAVSAQVVLTKEKSRVHAEVTLHARGEHFLHGEGSGRDVDTALSVATDKVDRQVRSLKSRWSKGRACPRRKPRPRRRVPNGRHGHLPGEGRSLASRGRFASCGRGATR
jgi:ribosomal subunit interface protein